MNLRKRIATSLMLFFTLAATSHAGPRAATIATPAPGVSVAAADYSFYNHTDHSHNTLQAATHRVRKVLDLSEMSEKDFAAIRTAKVSVFMHTEGVGEDGPDVQFNISANGHDNTFSTRNLVSSGWGLSLIHI